MARAGVTWRLAGAANHRHDPIPAIQTDDAVAGIHHLAERLMSQHQTRFSRRRLAQLERRQRAVCTADAHFVHPVEDLLIGEKLRRLQFAPIERARLEIKRGGQALIGLTRRRR